MTIERDDAEELHRSAESEELRVLELHLRRAGAIIGRMLIDRWHLPPDAVAGFLDETNRHWKLFCRSVANPEKWVVERIVKLARQYMESRGMALPAGLAEEDPPHILDVIRNEAALQTLPPKVGQVFMLFLEGHPPEWIAEELDTTEVYVKKLITIAVNRLHAWRPRREK